MNPRKLVPVFVCLLAACSHPLDIVGEGDILSASGENDCLSENAPCDVLAVREYRETYRPQARPGYEFVGWQGCLEQQGEACVFDIEAEVVRRFWGRTLPPVVARFAPLCPDAPASTFAAIEQAIFQGKGCAAAGCHGSAQQAGLRLSSGQAFGNIVNQPASQSSLNRVQPGNAGNSYLYRKVAAKTLPGSFAISGNPMPTVGSALTQEELLALALWINVGAPQGGRADDLNSVEQLLGLCN